MLALRADVLALLLDGYAEWAGQPADTKPAASGEKKFTTRGDGKIEMRIDSLDQLSAFMKGKLL